MRDTSFFKTTIVLGSQRLAKNNTIQLIHNLLGDHDRLAVPPCQRPVSVKLGLGSMEFSEISVTNMAFTLSYYLRLFWTDPRLSFYPGMYGNISAMVLDPIQFEKLWKSSIFYRNEKGSSLTDQFSMSNSLFRIYSTRDFYFSRRLETTFRCQMDLRAFPFDIQQCQIYIGSQDKSASNVGTFAGVKIIFRLKGHIAYYILEVIALNILLDKILKFYVAIRHERQPILSQNLSHPAVTAVSHRCLGLC